MKTYKILLLIISSAIFFDASAMKKRKEIEPVRSGANPTIKNNKGETAWDILYKKLSGFRQAASLQRNLDYQPIIAFYEKLNKLFRHYGAQ